MDLIRNTRNFINYFLSLCDIHLVEEFLVRLNELKFADWAIAILVKNAEQISYIGFELPNNFRISVTQALKMALRSKSFKLESELVFWDFVVVVSVNDRKD